jgi:NAD+ diphosphatase
MTMDTLASDGGAPAPRHPAARTTTPLSVYLPFNRDCVGDQFEPAKKGGKPPGSEGHWLIVQNQALVVVPDGDGFRLPTGARPSVLDGVGGQPFWLGTYKDTPCWVMELPRDAAIPSGFQRQTLVPMQGTKLPDDLLSLGGMAMQALWWESTSGHCPRCGELTTRIEGEWAVIVLVRDGDRCLLARKAIWAPGRYALVAGFVDNGESLEGCVRREVKEEVGVDVDDIQYVGSQNWPFPSQLMVGFVARYAGGEVKVDPEELEDARWFPKGQLPSRPSHHSIAGFILKNYGE